MIYLFIPNAQTIALEWWEKHLKRNDSFIVLLFHGQNKVGTICTRNPSHVVNYNIIIFIL